MSLTFSEKLLASDGTADEYFGIVSVIIMRLLVV